MSSTYPKPGELIGWKKHDIQVGLFEAEYAPTNNVPKKERWSGTWPHFCDICDADLTQEKWFADAVIGGVWGLYCPACFREGSGVFSVGRGQKYDSHTLEKLEG